MFAIDAPLPRGFRYYDPQIKWQAPAGLTIQQLADALYQKWVQFKDIKIRSGVPITREFAMATIAKYIQMVFGQSIAGYNAPAPPAPVFRSQSAPAPAPPKRTKCCGH